MWSYVGTVTWHVRFGECLRSECVGTKEEMCVSVMGPGYKTKALIIFLGLERINPKPDGAEPWNTWVRIVCARVYGHQSSASFGLSEKLLKGGP